jgi:hypothetical protein
LYASRRLEDDRIETEKQRQQAELHARDRRIALEAMFIAKVQAQLYYAYFSAMLS